MHVIIDGLGARNGGGITRLLGIVKELPRVAPQHQFSIVLAPRYQQRIIDQIPAGVTVVPMRMLGANLLARSYFQNVTLPGIAGRVGADVVLAAGEGAYCRSPQPLVMISGNMTLFRHSASARTGAAVMYRLFRRPLLLRSFRTASRIVFVSEAMRDAVKNELELPSEKVTVIHHGVDSRFTARSSEPQNAYYLAVSSINQHKGYEDLVAAWSLLREPPRLLIAGGVVDAVTADRVSALLREKGLGSLVQFLGPVSYEEMPTLYRGARALVFPSRLESFGLPLLEAMASGVPVLASDLSICREVCGDAALYFASRHPESLAAAVERIDQDPRFRSELARRGAIRARQFTWEGAARALVGTFEAVCGHTRRACDASEAAEAG